jgi:phosphate transport system permease protein
MSTLTGAATVAALLPLFSVLYLLIKRGAAALSMTSLTTLPPAAMAPGGGCGNAIVGTLVIVAIATLLSVPLGILGAIFVSEFGASTRTASAVRFAAKVLTGFPLFWPGFSASRLW